MGGELRRAKGLFGRGRGGALCGALRGALGIFVRAEAGGPGFMGNGSTESIICKYKYVVAFEHTVENRWGAGCGWLQ